MLTLRNMACLLLVVAVCTVQAQQSVVPQQPDSARRLVDSAFVSQKDSVKNKADNAVISQPPDSMAVIPSQGVATAEKKLFKPNPKKAVIYSALFPGLGQIYNRKYWKLPILYGGFVGFSYAVTWNNGHYQDYFGAYRDMIDDDPNTNRWHKLVPYQYKDTPESIDKQWFSGVLKDRKNYYRYYRDFSIILTVAWYALGIVDAYVDAQLFEFDVSPDLSMRVEPMMLKKTDTHYLANSYGFRCSFSF